MVAQQAAGAERGNAPEGIESLVNAAWLSTRALGFCTKHRGELRASIMPANAHVRDGRGIAEVVVPRSVETVFDYVSDLRHMPTWWSEHESYLRLVGAGGPGTFYAWAMHRGPIPFAPPFGGLTVVTVLERSNRFAYRILSPGLLTRMSYEFTRTSDGTHVRLESRSAAYRLAFFARNFSEQVAPALDTLAATLTSSRS